MISFGQNAGEWDEDNGGYVPEINPKHTFNAEVRIPITVENIAYKRTVKAMVEGSVSYAYHFPFHLTIGAGLRVMYNQVNVTQVEPGLTGGIGSIGPYLKIGYERFVSDRMALEGALKVGGFFNTINTSKNRQLLGESLKSDCLVIEPNVSVILSASANTSFRLNVGYSILGYRFHPYDLGSSSVGGFAESDLNKRTQIVNVGFGFTYYFGQY